MPSTTDLAASSWGRVFVLFAAALLVIGCSAEPKGVIYIVRHAEKSTTPAGDPALTEAGESRALDLAEKLGDKPIIAVYSTDTTLTQRTAAPLAAKLGLPVQSYRDSAALVEQVRRAHEGQSVAIVGHSNTVPQLIAAFGATPPPEVAGGIPEDQYDNLYLLELSAEAPTLTALKF